MNKIKIVQLPDNQFEVYHYENKEYILKYIVNYFTTEINLIISSILKYLYQYSFDNMIVNNINTLIVSYDYKPPFYKFKFNNKLIEGFNYEV